MYIPEIGTRIKIDGRDGEFLLVHADEGQMVAAVVSLTGKRVLEEGIPVGDLRRLGADVSLAVDWVGDKRLGRVVTDSDKKLEN